MIKIPLAKIIGEIKKEKNISEAEINKKIDDKLKELSGLVSREGAAHIIANELGVNLYRELTGKVKISSVLAGMREIETLGKVQRIFEIRQFDTGQRKGSVANIIIADETGTCRVVLWNDKTSIISQLKENDIVRIKNAYSRDNQGRVELHLNDKSEFIINPEGEKIEEVKEYSSLRKEIKEIQDGDQNIEILGTVVQASDPRYFEICPTCGKRAMLKGGNEFVCEEHGVTAPAYSYVINFVVDDGTESIRCVAFKRQAEKLLNKDLAEIRNNPAEIEKIKTGLIGNIVKLIGRANKNQMFDRLEFMTQLVFPEPDPQEELKRLEQYAV
jgi:ssDNA-binding replication factor A large subunit